MKELPVVLVARSLDFQQHACQQGNKVMSNGVYISWIILFWLVVVLCFLLFGEKERTKKMMDRRRHALQAELDDPVLREGLLRRAPINTPPDEFLEHLEQRIANWDSKKFALRLLRRKVRRFRIVTVVTALWNLAEIAHFYVHNDNDNDNDNSNNIIKCLLGAHHWKVVLFALLVLLLSYRISLHDKEEEEEHEQGASRRGIILLDDRDQDASSTELLMLGDEESIARPLLTMSDETPKAGVSHPFS